MALNKMIKVEVAYATKTVQRIIAVEIEAGSTIQMAIDRSGIMHLFPEINLAKQKIGVFSKSQHLHDLVNEGDRIEIYRPLSIDPKEARRLKAARSKLKRG